MSVPNDWNPGMDMPSQGDFGVVQPSASPGVTPVGIVPVGGPPIGVSSVGALSTSSIGNPPGEVTSPRLYARAGMLPMATQLQVGRLVNGQIASLGPAAIDITEERFIQQFYDDMPKLGDGIVTFHLRPVDVLGRAVGQDAVWPISEHHLVLKRLRAAQPPASGVVSSGGVNLDATGLIDRTVSLIDRRAEELARTLEAERARWQRLAEEHSQERIAMASSAVASVQAAAERSAKADAERAKEASDSMAAFYHSQLEMVRLQQAGQQQAWERELARAEAQRLREVEDEKRRREADRLEWERRIGQEREEHQRRVDVEKRETEDRWKRFELEMKAREADAQRRREEERAAEERRRNDEQRRLDEQLDRYRLEEQGRESERQRHHDFQLKELELAAKRDAETQERHLALITAQVKAEGGGGLGDVVGKGITALRAVGIEPLDIAKRAAGAVLGQEGSGPGATGWLDVANTAVTHLGGIFNQIVSAREQVRAEDARAAQAEIAAAEGAGAPVPTALVPAGGRAFPLSSAATAPAFAASALSVPAGIVQAAVAAPQVPSVQASPVQPVGVPLSVQRAARVAIRQLISQLRTTPGEEWMQIVTAVLAGVPEVLPYLGAVGVSAALREGGASEEMLAQVLEGVRQGQAAGLVPADVRL